MYNCGRLWWVTVTKQDGTEEKHSFPTLADAQSKAYTERLDGNHATIEREEPDYPQRF